MIDGAASEFTPLHRGVPQGATLSPLLFSVYMNDIPFRDTTNLFADETLSTKHRRRDPYETAASN